MNFSILIASVLWFLHWSIQKSNLSSPLVSFFLLLVFTLPQSRNLHAPGLTTEMPLGQMPVGEQLSMDQNSRQIHKGGPAWMCGQHNVRASAEDNTWQNPDKGHTPIPGQKFKFLTPPGIEPEPPGWKAGSLPTTLRRQSINFRDINFLVYKFQNVPCALGFEVKHSKFFYRSFRTCTIILSLDFTINKLFCP